MSPTNPKSPTDKPILLLPAANQQDVEARALAKQLYEVRQFRKDPFWAIQAGYVLTEDEHASAGESAQKPFPPAPHIEALAKVVMGSPIGMVMKSRQLMMSWFFCWLVLWEATVNSGRLCVAQGKREEDVAAKGTKALMGRIRYMRRNLPKHLQPIIVEEAKTTEVYANGSTIMGIPQGEDVIRSLTASFVFMDELSRHPQGEAAWTAALPTVRGGGRLWGVSTPNGREFCYDQADKRLPWDAWEKWPSVMQGLHGYKNVNGVQLVALHYTADPLKRTTEYQEMARRGYTNANLYRQENELDFSLQPGDPVFAEFEDGRHVLKSNYVPNPAMPIYTGWDFGYNGNSVSFFQHNASGQLVWFDQIIFKRVALPDVCRHVQRRLLWAMGRHDNNAPEKVEEVPLYDMEGKAIDGARLARTANVARSVDVFYFGDPSGEATNNKGDSDRSTLLTFGMNLRTRATVGRKRDLVEQLRAMLMARSDGTPGLIISPGPSMEMRYVVEGFKGGYRYPERKMGRADKQLPDKDGFYDHIFDSAQYAIDHIRPIRAAVIDEVGEGGDWWKDSSWIENPWVGWGDGTEAEGIH
jgi:hypothetical protein